MQPAVPSSLTCDAIRRVVGVHYVDAVAKEPLLLLDGRANLARRGERAHPSGVELVAGGGGSGGWGARCGHSGGGGSLDRRRPVGGRPEVGLPLKRPRPVERRPAERRVHVPRAARVCEEPHLRAGRPPSKNQREASDREGPARETHALPPRQRRDERDEVGDVHLEEGAVRRVGLDERRDGPRDVRALLDAEHCGEDRRRLLACFAALLVRGLLTDNDLVAGPGQKRWHGDKGVVWKEDGAVESIAVSCDRVPRGAHCSAPWCTSQGRRRGCPRLASPHTGWIRCGVGKR